MLKIKYFLILCLAVGITFMGCESEPKTKKPNNGQGNVVQPPPKFEAVAPPFNADSAYAYIEKQLEFGPRIPNTPAHVACANWMAGMFDRFGAQVYVQKANVTAWDGTNFAIQNIIASYNPQASKRMLISAHWDSRPFADKDPVNPNAPVPAANDGGSGVGVILELARQLQQTPPTIGVDFMLWDAEDYGNYDIDDSWCLGSKYWARNPHQKGYKAEWGINLDMVGAKGAQFVQDGYSLAKARQFVDRYWSVAFNLGFASYFPVGDFGMYTIDDHVYIMDIAGIPMVEIIHRDINTSEFFPHWHKTTDDMEPIDKEVLRVVGQTTLEVILREK